MKGTGLLRYEEGELTEGAKRVASGRALLFLRNLHLMDYDIKLLVESVYLQGLRDMAETVIRNPSSITVSEPEDVLDYTI